VIHLTAIAGRRGIRLTPATFDAISRSTPLLANLKPSGEFQMQAFFDAGGMPALLKELEPLLHLDATTVGGNTLGEALRGARKAERRRDVIAALDAPRATESGLAAVFGNLAPDGALIKTAAASPALLTHRGRAVVFSSPADLQARLNDAALNIRPDDVLVLQYAGPVGGPGMPEVGNMPLPTALLRQGVRDMVRISDARMSGTAFGTIVLHVSPEAAVGGPLALVQTGDVIELDVPHRRIDVLVDDATLAQRRSALRTPALAYSRGYRRLFLDHVQQAHLGCDFGFLLPE
jgi:dihydroxy-acid dehydratase